MPTPGDNVVAFKSTDGNWFAIDLDDSSSGGGGNVSEFHAGSDADYFDYQASAHGDQTVLTLSFTAPADGVLYIFGRVRWDISYTAATNAQADHYVKLDGTALPNYADRARQRLELSTGAFDEHDFTQVLHAVAAVTAGAHTLDVVVTAQTTNTTVVDVYPMISALLVMGSGGPASTNYWTYDGSMLSPDPATTTPLDVFQVQTVEDILIQADVDGAGGFNFILRNYDGVSEGGTIQLDGKNLDLKGAANNILIHTTSSGNIQVNASSGAVIVGNSLATALQFYKRTDPSAADANSGFLYLRDNGSGKMQFVARFPSGAVQVIATEP